MTPLASIDGRVMPLAEARISPLDRGFLFGDAVYEVVRVYRGRPFLFDRHLARLRRSLEAIRIVGIDLARLQRRVGDLIAAAGFAEATVYIQITRGSGRRSHAFPPDATPLEFLYVDAYDDPYVDLRRTGIAVITHPDIRWLRCDIKSTNLLGNVLAAQAAKEAGANEVLLHQDDGTMTEGSRTNVFGVRDGTVVTAPRSTGILPGITRELVLELAQQSGIAWQERPLHLNDLRTLEELFVTGTTSEVLPVVRVDGEAVGTGQPGPISRRLQQAYRAYVEAVS